MLVNAPGVRCPQLAKPATVAQSMFDVHGTARHFCAPHWESELQLAPEAVPPHVRANVLDNLFLQKPQKTFV